MYHIYLDKKKGEFLAGDIGIFFLIFSYLIIGKKKKKKIQILCIVSIGIFH